MTSSSFLDKMDFHLVDNVFEFLKGHHGPPLVHNVFEFLKFLFGTVDAVGLRGCVLWVGLQPLKGLTSNVFLPS